MSKKGERGGQAPQEVAHATLNGGTVANAANINASSWPAVANAHAVFVRPCGLKSPAHRLAIVANAVNRDASFWPAVANAHAVLASSCGLKFFDSTLSMCRSAVLANTMNSMPSDVALQLHAAPYAILASSRAPISWAMAACTVC